MVNLWLGIECSMSKVIYVLLIAHDFALPERAYRVNFSDGTYLMPG